MRCCRRRARVPSGSNGATTATTLSCRTCSVTTPAWTSPSSCHHCTALLLISLFSLASFITSPTHFTVALDDVDLLHESEREGGGRTPISGVRFASSSPPGSPLVEQGSGRTASCDTKARTRPVQLPASAIRERLVGGAPAHQVSNQPLDKPWEATKVGPQGEDSLQYLEWPHQIGNISSSSNIPIKI